MKLLQNVSMEPLIACEESSSRAISKISLGLVFAYTVVNLVDRKIHKGICVVSLQETAQFET